MDRGAHEHAARGLVYHTGEWRFSKVSGKETEQTSLGLFLLLRPGNSCGREPGAVRTPDRPSPCLIFRKATAVVYVLGKRLLADLYQFLADYRLSFRKYADIEKYSREKKKVSTIHTVKWKMWMAVVSLTLIRTPPWRGPAVGTQTSGHSVGCWACPLCVWGMRRWSCGCRTGRYTEMSVTHTQ